MSVDISYTQNRELSWLAFNERVLAEALDNTVPLGERLKFIAIFLSNLDEFFMIRVGSLYDLSLLKDNHRDNKSLLTPAEQLSEVFKAVRPLYAEKDQIFLNVEKELRTYDLYNLTVKELEETEQNFIRKYFVQEIMPLLSPQIIDSHHPFPHLVNCALYIAVSLSINKKKTFGLVPVPLSLPEAVFLPGNSLRYILIEKIILEYAAQIFTDYTIEEKTVLRVTRNADINPEDELLDMEKDYLDHMQRVLKKRSRLAPVRLELQKNISNEFMDFLLKKLNLKKEQVFRSKTPLNLKYVFSLEEKMSLSLKRSLYYPPFKSAEKLQGESVLNYVLKQDMLLFYPYDSFNTFLRLIKEAAYDPKVISIKITIYRLSSHNPKLINYLIAAAEMGKQVTALVELKARFDEENNIVWAKSLEEAGCQVIYGFEGFKVHSKICLITRKDNRQIQYITQIGTGNYNEKTARLYTDFSLITANQSIGLDAVSFFKNMLIANLDGHYEKLLVAPGSLKSQLFKLIDQETAKGSLGRIIIKINSLTDRNLIDKLAEASQAGVSIQLIVRGICCLLPGIQGKTERVTVRSIVGRFLEHSRIYCFGSGDEQRMYISSADLMTRSTERRVELACPVLDDRIQEEIMRFLRIMLSDNVKARIMQSDGSYKAINNINKTLVNSQEIFLNDETIDKSPMKPNKMLQLFHLLSQKINKKSLRF